MEIPATGSMMKAKNITDALLMERMAMERQTGRVTDKYAEQTGHAKDANKQEFLTAPTFADN